MRYYEVLVADSKYKSSSPLTYSYGGKLENLSVVTVPLRSRAVTGFVLNEVGKPSFAVKEIKSLISKTPLPYHCLELAQWMSAYYAVGLGECLRQFAPSKPAIRQIKADETMHSPQIMQLEMKTELTIEQQRAVLELKDGASTTMLLHGETGSGKTRVYLELAAETLRAGKSVIILTPEISLTTQLAASASAFLDKKPVVFHSQLTSAKRKQIWLQLLESNEPHVIIGPRSALLTPVSLPGLIVVDEAHEPAYKQEQSPRYNALRVASQLGSFTGARVIYGTATPLVTDYYLAEQKKAIVRMSHQAIGEPQEVKTEVIDLKDRSNFTRDPYLSKQLIESVNQALAAKKQAIIYLNRRGSARVILCNVCGWQYLCPTATYHWFIIATSTKSAVTSAASVILLRQPASNAITWTSYIRLSAQKPWPTRSKSYFLIRSLADLIAIMYPVKS